MILRTIILHVLSVLSRDCTAALFTIRRSTPSVLFFVVLLYHCTTDCRYVRAHCRWQQAFLNIVHHISRIHYGSKTLLWIRIYFVFHLVIGRHCQRCCACVTDQERRRDEDDVDEVAAAMVATQHSTGVALTQG